MNTSETAIITTYEPTFAGPASEPAAAAPTVGASRPRVALVHGIWDSPETPERALMVMSLLRALEIIPLLAICEPAPRASADDLCRYHSAEYVELLRLEDGEDEEVLARHGLSYDAPLFPGVWEYSTTVAGGSLRAAELLATGACDVAIHWQGGRHHATSDRAGGFCYVNDIVLAALRLVRAFRTVVVIDLDVHHGNGTEEAFAHSANVLNVSLHLHAPGFYPGTGALADCGSGRGTGTTVNVPLRPGLSPAAFARVFAEVAALTHRWVGEQHCGVVVQCGADGLRGDPRGGLNLDPASLAAAVGTVLGWGLPTLLLGGGGYVETNVARAWALCTATALGVEIEVDQQIPDSDEYYERYRDGSFLLRAVGTPLGGERGEEPAPLSQSDQNDEVYLQQLLSTLRARFPPAAAGEALRGSLPDEGEGGGARSAKRLRAADG
ncbi:hypothetical protein T492DRAFT_982542 [Pavlovales sp. CCMP2436]|nr:hypothetical protein T492DRAFT_982542 [Pavlovales sp. CCMP2436]